jgi:hypothetical protein
MQDTFASAGLLLLGYPVCDDTIFGETEIELEMCGTHQWWTFVGSVSHDELRPYLSFLLTLHVDKT